MPRVIPSRSANVFSKRYLLFRDKDVLSVRRSDASLTMSEQTDV